MSLVINGNHTSHLATALMEVQRRCTARLLTVEKIESILDDADAHLNIPKNKMRGIVLEYTGAEHFPRCYKYPPESTWFTAEHNGRYWVIKHIARHACPNRLDNVSITLTEAAREAIISHAQYFRVSV